MPLTFVLLGLAFLAAWSTPAPPASRYASWPWQGLVLCACLSALNEDLMSWQGVPVVVGLWLAAMGYALLADRRMRWASGALAVVLAAALAIHRVPGFGVYLVAENIRLSPQSAPMTVTASVDKGFAGVVLLATFCRRSPTIGAWCRAAGVGFAVGAATYAVVVPLALAAGAVRFDPKLPHLLPTWMAINLLFTCVGEEAIFRGVLQERLSRWCESRPGASWLPLAVASALFGLAHAGGGPILVAIAGVAGLGYGAAYALTRRIEAAVMAHFTLNSMHFVLLTYPYAAR